MSVPAAADVLRRRRQEREQRVDDVGRWARSLPESCGVRTVVVVGSVARGDFHDVSDTDVVVVADVLPDDPVERLRSLGLPPVGVEVVARTLQDWWRAVRRGDPLAVEAVEVGVVVVSSPPPVRTAGAAGS